MPTTKKDTRPRFGFCWDLDREPQYIHERRDSPRDGGQAVAVIPLPFQSPKMKAKVRAFAKTLLPSTR